MANTKISALPAAATLTGPEQFPLVQGGATKVATLTQLVAALQGGLLQDLPEWQPSTGYTAGQLVLNPSGQIVSANATFTSGASYNTANWTVVSLTVAGVQALIAAQAASDAATYAPLASFLAPTVAAFGDSETAHGDPYLAYAAALAGNFRVTGIYSHPGYTSTALLPLITDVTEATDKPSTCIVLCGANDAQTSVPLATFATNVTAIVAALRAANVTPILGTIPPLTDTGARAYQQLYNVWLQRYAASERINLVPFATVLTGPDGDYAPGMETPELDGIHQSNAGNKAMGQAFADALRFPSTDGLLPAFDGGINLAPNGLFVTDTNADGLPDQYGATPQTGLSYELDTVAGVPGKVLKITLNNVATSPVAITGGEIDAGPTTFAVGDRIRVAARVGAGQDGGSSNLQLTCFQAGYAAVTGNIPLFSITGLGSFTQALDGGIVQQEFTVPANTGLMVFQWSLAGNGSYTAAQLGVWNLTKLGVA